MILQVCSVFDSSIDAFLPPFFVAHRNLAIRAFSEAARNPEHDFYKHSHSFTLYLIGEFDDCTGNFTSRNRELLVSAATVWAFEKQSLAQELQG